MQYFMACITTSQVFERFKLNDNFINIVNKSVISNSALAFEISIAKFLKKYPRMKNPSVCLHFLKNNFKIIEEICH